MQNVAAPNDTAPATVVLEPSRSIWATLTASPRRLAWIKAILLAVVTILVIMLRRPDQFAAPYVWVEDGTVNLKDFLANGWSSLWHPVSGYFSVPIKFVHALSVTLSFRWLPEISLALTLGVCYGVLAAIAFAPTALRYPFACSVAVLLIPTDAEVFGVSLYVGWWCTLLALVALFWNLDGRRPFLRVVLLAIGALSSPLIVGLVPLFVARAVFIRRRGEAIAASVATGLAALQWTAASRAGIAPTAALLGVKPSALVERFFGYYLDSAERFIALGGSIYLGALLIIFLAAVWLAYRRELGSIFVLLGFAFGVAVAASASRIPIDIINPIYGGPRYFFFPYILLTWMLLQIASLPREGLRLVVGMLLAMAFRNTLDGGRRMHHALDWRGEIRRCLELPGTQLRVHFVGDSNNVWQVDMTREDCAALVRRSWFDNAVAP